MSRRAVGLAIVVALAAGAIVAGLALPTDAIATRLAHPVRVDAMGHPPPTTVEGARLLRLALVAAPPLLVALGFLLWRSARGPRERLFTSPSSRRERGWLYAILALALVLRLVRLGDSLWYDEIAGLLGYSIHGPLVVAGNYFSPANHILSQILVWASAALFDAGETSVRLPSLLAGLLAIPGTYLLGREAGGWRVGLFAAAAIALFPIAILASDDARGYSLMIALAALQSWLYLVGRRANRASVWWLYAIAVALGGWNHLVSLCVAVGHGACAAVDLARGRERRRAATALVALVIAALLVAALWSPALPDLVAMRAQFRVRTGETPTILGPEGWHAFLALGGSWSWWAAIPGLALAAIGLASSFGQRAARGALAASGAGIVVAVAASALLGTWMYARFFLFAAPFAALLVGLGLDALTRRGRRVAGIALAALGACAIAEILVLPPRQPLREAIERVAAARKDPGDAVGVVGLNDQVLLLYATPLHVPLVDYGPNGVRLADELPRTRPPFVLVLYPQLLTDAQRAALAHERYRLDAELPGWIDWGRGAVQIWTRGD